MAYKIIAVMKDGTTINQEIDDAVALAARYADLVHGRENYVCGRSRPCTALMA